MTGDCIFSHNKSLTIQIVLPYSIFGSGFDFCHSLKSTNIRLCLCKELFRSHCFVYNIWQSWCSQFGEQPAVTSQNLTLSNAVESISCHLSLLKTNLLETVWRISISLLCHHTDPLPENISRIIIILFSLLCYRLTLQEMSVHTCFPMSATCSNTWIQLSCCCRGLGCKYYMGLLCTCFFNHIFVITGLQRFVLSYHQWQLFEHVLPQDISIALRLNHSDFNSEIHLIFLVNLDYVSFSISLKFSLVSTSNQLPLWINRREVPGRKATAPSCC